MSGTLYWKPSQNNNGSDAYIDYDEAVNRQMTPDQALSDRVI